MIKTFLILIMLALVLVPNGAADYTLTVFGNANLDEVIDEEDAKYVQGVLEGTNEATQFADANCDGQIDENDIFQIELILSGDEKELTLVDYIGRTVTLDVPIEKVVSVVPSTTRVIAHLEATDKIIGIDSKTVDHGDDLILLQAYPELKDLPGVGMWSEPNSELMVELEPNVILTYTWGYKSNPEIPNTIQMKTGIPVVCLEPCYNGDEYNAPKGPFETWRLAGLILDEEERAEELISYCDEKINEIEDITSVIPEEDKPRVYLVGCCDPSLTVTTNVYEPIDIAGGINVAGGIAENTWWGGVNVPKEQVIYWDPDIILISSSSQRGWITVDEILSDPTLQDVSAIKNKRVYSTKGWFAGWDPATGLCECLYLAKIFHPTEFEYLNVEEECNEILEEFYGKEGLYYWVQDYCKLYTWDE